MVEGDQPGEDRRTVILEFDSLEKANGWYYSDDYAGPKELRIASTISKPPSRSTAAATWRAAAT